MARSTVVSSDSKCPRVRGHFLHDQWTAYHLSATAQLLNKICENLLIISARSLPSSVYQVGTPNTDML